MSEKKYRVVVSYNPEEILRRWYVEIHSIEDGLYRTLFTRDLVEAWRFTHAGAMRFAERWVRKERKQERRRAERTAELEARRKAEVHFL